MQTNANINCNRLKFPKNQTNKKYEECKYFSTPIKKQEMAIINVNIFIGECGQSTGHLIFNILNGK